MATEYGSRLRLARKNARLTQAKLSKMTGIPQSTISTAEREGHGSGETPVYARACGVNALWLATGEGSMLSDIATQQQSFLDLNKPISAESIVLAATKNVAQSAEAIMLGTMLDTIKDPLRRLEVMSACVNLIVLTAPQTAPKSPPALADAAKMSGAKSPV